MQATNPTISILSEIPESLHTQVQQFLNDNPSWDCDRTVQAALSLFLMQNGQSNQEVSRVYLNSVFGEVK